MAELRPCVECRRHVSIDEQMCPFCSATLAVAASQRVSLAARASRAAVFASAALASACGPAKKSNVPAPQQLPDASVRDAPSMQTENPPEPDRSQPEASPVKMPYGAPPARRRVV